MAYGSAFESFLDAISTCLHKEPNQSSTLNSFDISQINNDIMRYKDVFTPSGDLLAADNMKLFMQEKQSELTNNILDSNTVNGFEGFVKFGALSSIARNGV